MTGLASPDMQVTPTSEQSTPPKVEARPISQRAKEMWQSLRARLIRPNRNPDAASQEIAGFSADSVADNETEPEPKKRIIDEREDPIGQLDGLMLGDQLADPEQLNQLAVELATYPNLTYSQGRAIFERLGKVSKRFSRFRWPLDYEERSKYDQDFWEAEKKLRRFTKISEDIDDLEKALSENPEFGKVEHYKLVDNNNPFYKFVVGADRQKYYFDQTDRAVKRNSDGKDVRGALEREIASSKGFKERVREFENLAMEDTWGYIQMRPKEGVLKNPEGLGRVYIDQNFEIKAPSTPRGITDVFWDLTSVFNHHPDLFEAIKVYDFNERGGWAFVGVDTVIEDLSRTDSIVIYFDMSKREEIYDYLGYRFSGQDEAISLDPVIPRFSELTRWGGIGFAEEVDEQFKRQGLSRNQLIAQVLQETVVSVPGGSEDRNTFERVLQENFRRFKIDPNNPAYSLS